MSAHRLRAAAAASALAVLALGFGTSAAHAAGATLKLPSDVVDIGAPFDVSGTCTAGSRSAVVTVSQDGQDLASAAADLAGDLSFTATLDLSDLEEGEARAVVACFNYPDRDPVATAAESFYAYEGAAPYEVEVHASPTKVALGGTITITAACKPGTPDASVLLGNSTAKEPFAEASAKPAADGSVSVKMPIVRDADLEDSAAPKAGDAIAVVFCGDLTTGDGEFGVGMSEFTITRAAASAIPAADAGNDPDAAGGLANTGAQTAPLTALAGAMLLGGVGLHRLRRKVSAV